MAMELPPGLRGYVAAEQQGQQQQLGQLQQAQVLMGLQGQMQQAQKARQYEAALQGLPAGASGEDHMRAVAPFVSPDKLADINSRSQDKKAALEQRASEALARQQAAEQNATMIHEFRMSRLQTDRDRAAETARHNKSMEGIQAQNAALSAQLKTMGIDIQKMRLEQSQGQAKDKQIEQQINQTANRLKDVQPVMTAARQLNDLLDKFTPDDVPCVGYLKNTDTGKFFLSSEGKDVSSSIKLVGNAILKALSGTAVTAPEEVRQMAAQMADGRYSAKDFYTAWPKISSWLNDQQKVATSSLSDPARERFVERTGLNLDPIKPRFNVEYQNGQMNLRDTHRGAAAPAGAVPPPPPGFKVN